MKIIVNDQEITCKADISLLKNLLAAKFKIPTLCYHPALGADGRCGLCMVEVLDNGQWEVAMACQITTSEGLQVRTETERVLRMRGLSAQLLLHHAPYPNKEVSIFLQEIAEAGNIRLEPETLAAQTGSGCILCGLCVRACMKTGRGSLTFVGKGQEMKIKSWSDRSTCNLCTACMTVCPTGFMNMDTKTKIIIER